MLIDSIDFFGAIKKWSVMWENFKVFITNVIESNFSVKIDKLNQTGFGILAIYCSIQFVNPSHATDLFL